MAAINPVLHSSGFGGAVSEGLIEITAANTEMVINCGFRPRIIMLMGARLKYFNFSVYNTRISEDSNMFGWRSVNGDSDGSSRYRALPQTGSGILKEVTDTGFVIQTGGSASAWYPGGTLAYAAIG